MTARLARVAASSARLLRFQSLASPSVLPPNLGTGRFVWQIRARGYGYPGLNDVPQEGLSVWDWVPSLNKYVLSNFATTTDWMTKFFSGNGVFCMVNATTVIAAASGIPEDSTTTAVYRAVTTIGAAPSASITFSTPYALAYNEPVPNVAYYGAPAAYANSAIFGFGGSNNPSFATSVNGWVEKLSGTAAARNATALRTGLPVDQTQGRPALSSAMLGGAAPNGYVVVDVSDNSAGGKKFQLVNATATPVAVGAQLNFVGNFSPDLKAVIAIGASKVVAFDISPKANLLYVNSATAPTTLTKGGDVLLPEPIDFPVAEQSFRLVLSTTPNDGTQFFTEGKAMAWMYWSRTNGEEYQRPMILTSSSNTSLGLSLPLVDMTGRPSPVWRGDAVDFRHPIVSAPGNKAVIFMPIGTTGEYEQFVYQL